MISRWVSVLEIRFPRTAKLGHALFSGSTDFIASGSTHAIRKGAAAFAGATSFVANGVSYLTTSVLFSGATSFIAKGASYLRAAASFVGNMAFTANGTVQPLPYWGFLMYGSFAGGSSGAPVSTTPVAKAKMFAGGVVVTGAGEMSSIVQLQETADGSYGETPAAGYVTESIAPLGKAVFASVAPATILANSLSGSSAYTFAKSEVQAAKTLLGAGMPGVSHVFWFEGYDDQGGAFANYATNLASLQSQLNADIKAITGQAADVPLYVYQQCILPPGQSPVEPNIAKSTALGSLTAHRANPTKIILIGPDYALPRRTADGLHYAAHSQRAIGCMIARVAARIAAGGTTSPLMPTSVVRSGADIDITFNVPTPPLVFDLASVFNPASQVAGNQYGFRYTDDSASASIASVTITGPDTVRVTLDAVPTGANKKICYAIDPASDWAPDPSFNTLNRNRGNLRDSNVEPNSYGYDSYNWCVVFREDVP